MNDSIFSKHIKSPSILRQALYLGKLKATTVEVGFFFYFEGIWKFLKAIKMFLILKSEKITHF